MSELDWRSPEAYKRMQAADAPDFAWECLRRNDDYRRECRAFLGGGSVEVTAEFRRRWGLSFRR